MLQGFQPVPVRSQLPTCAMKGARVRGRSLNPLDAEFATVGAESSRAA